jgi:hypothetical protein
MIKIVFCDRCNKEMLEKVNMTTFSEIWDSLEESQLYSDMKIVRIIKPQLCKPCGLKFNNLIGHFKGEISAFLKEGKKKKEEPNKKKGKRFGFMNR